MSAEHTRDRQLMNGLAVVVSTGRIAVRVIDNLGYELKKVFRV